jgi:hypothetical protein
MDEQDVGWRNAAGADEVSDLEVGQMWLTKLQIPDSVPVPKTRESTSRILFLSVPTVIPKKVIGLLCCTLRIPPPIDPGTFR